jgi:MFS family permease
MLLQSISAISVVIMEVPTGAFADRIGRKKSVIISKLMWILSLFFYVIGETYLYFILAEVLFSIGISMKSGADTALIYDSMKYHNKEDEYSSVLGKATSNLFYSQAVGSLIAGFVYSIDEYLPMKLSIVFISIALIISLFFKEVPFKHSEHNESYMKGIKNSFKQALKSKKIIGITVFALLFFMLYRAGFWYFQPYLTKSGLDIKFFGLVFFIFNIVAGFFSRKINLFIALTKGRTFITMLGLLFISFILMALFTPIYGFIFILFQQMARGFYRPLINKYANKHIESYNRATMLSIISLVSNLSAALFLPIAGVIYDSYGISNSHIFLSVISLVSIIFLTSFLTKFLKS